MSLEVANLHKSYPQGGGSLEILRGVNLRLETGQTAAILGQSGSGKSTLLSLLAGLDRPDRGTISVEGTPIQDMDEHRLSRFRAEHLGIVFQQYHLISTLTALENIRLPLEFARDPEAESKAREALKSVGLENRAHHFPSQLSGGESQRIAIARAIVIRPKLLLADEPSGNLDTRTGDQVMGLMFDLVERNRMTLVLVTHNDALGARCHRQFHLKSGVLH